MTKVELHGLLRDRGHVFWTPEPDDTPVDVTWTSDVYTAVAADLDGTLKPKYRRRFFACQRTPGDALVILTHAAFALPPPLAAAADEDPADNLFARGPARWLLARLRRFSRLLLWPRGGFRGPDGLDFLLWSPDIGRLDAAPHLGRWLDRWAPDRADVAAGPLNLTAAGDCRAVWAAVNLVGRWGYEFYVADEDGREVYLMHHHDMVVASVPNAGARASLVAELGGLGEVLANRSGYR